MLRGRHAHQRCPEPPFRDLHPRPRRIRLELFFLWALLPLSSQVQPLEYLISSVPSSHPAGTVQGVLRLRHWALARFEAHFTDKTGFFLGLNVFEPVQDLPHNLSGC